MKLTPRSLLLAAILASLSIASASVNETNSTPCSTMTVSVRQDNYSWNGSNWQYMTTSQWSTSLSYGASFVVMDWENGAYRIDYSTTGTSTTSNETWTSFDEPQPWSYGSWSPSASSVPPCQAVTQSRSKTRTHRTGERSNCGNERNVSWYSESTSETQTVPGTGSLSWTAFNEVLSNWQEVSASPSCSSYSSSQVFTQNYNEQRTVRTGERSNCGDERNVVTSTESRSGSRTVNGCGP